jgi:hypothetical protein
LLENFINVTSHSERVRKGLVRKLLPKHEMQLDGMGNLIVGNPKDSGNVCLDAHIDAIIFSYQRSGQEEELTQVLAWYTRRNPISQMIFGKLSRLSKYLPSDMPDGRVNLLLDYLREKKIWKMI